jgi:hypothetical protein
MFSAGTGESALDNRAPVLAARSPAPAPTPTHIVVDVMYDAMEGRGILMAA